MINSSPLPSVINFDRFRNKLSLQFASIGKYDIQVFNILPDGSEISINYIFYANTPDHAACSTNVINTSNLKTYFDLETTVTNYTYKYLFDLTSALDDTACDTNITYSLESYEKNGIVRGDTSVYQFEIT
jgi:hypothetical protein